MRRRAGADADAVKREVARRVLAGEVPGDVLREVLRELVAEAVEHLLPPARVTVLASADGGVVRMRSEAVQPLDRMVPRDGRVLSMAEARRKRGIK